MSKYNKEFETSAMPEGQLLRLNEIATYLGVCTRTIQRYVDSGRLKQWKNRVNGRVYFDKADAMVILGSKYNNRPDLLNIVYCRVTSTPSPTPGNSAQARVDRQAERVMEYCTRAGIRVDRVIKEIRPANLLGSRGEVDDIFEMIFRKQVGTLIIETPDRLARWEGQDLFDRFFAWHGVDLHVINRALVMQEYKEEAKDDLASLLYQTKVLMGDL